MSRTKAINIFIGLSGFILILSLLLFGFSTQNTSNNDSDNELIEETGTVVYLSFEGGFYGILSDEGERYDPINLPLEYQKAGLRVRFTAKERNDLDSSHMWGSIMELINIYTL